MTKYLNQDHLIFQVLPEKLIFAVEILVNLALKCSHSFRIQFDFHRLKQVIGVEQLIKLMPRLAESTSLAKPTDIYEIYEEQLNAENVKILQCLLSFEINDWNDLPLNYIESITFLNEAEQIVFRGNEMMNFQLFALPEPEQEVLIEAYVSHDIPEEVIEQVEINLNSLYP